MTSLNRTTPYENRYDPCSHNMGVRMDCKWTPIGLQCMNASRDGWMHMRMAICIILKTHLDAGGEAEKFEHGVHVDEGLPHFTIY